LITDWGDDVRNRVKQRILEVFRTDPDLKEKFLPLLLPFREGLDVRPMEMEGPTPDLSILKKEIEDWLESVKEL